MTFHGEMVITGNVIRLQNILIELEFYGKNKINKKSTYNNKKVLFSIKNFCDDFIQL